MPKPDKQEIRQDIVVKGVIVTPEAQAVLIKEIVRRLEAMRQSLNAGSKVKRK